MLRPLILAALATVGCVETLPPLDETTSLAVELVAPADPGAPDRRLDDSARTVMIRVTAKDAQNQIDTGVTRHRRLRDVRAGYDGVEVLHGVSFTVSRRRNTMIGAPSGSRSRSATRPCAAVSWKCSSRLPGVPPPARTTRAMPPEAWVSSGRATRGWVTRVPLVPSRLVMPHGLATGSNQPTISLPASSWNGSWPASARSR